jgi:hypothetical protein
MLTSVGHPVRLVLAGFRRDRPHLYSHVYPEVQLKGQWIPIDPTVSRPMGWAPPALWKSVCHIEEEGIRCSRKTP